MKKAVIIGAGFSGMSAAYFLNREGFEVEVYEKESRPGGLIKTVQTQWGSCELAANGILNSKIFEKLAMDVGLEILPTQKVSRRRYIFRESLRRWPLNIFETLVLVFKFLFSEKRPKDEETILNWGERVMGVQATRYILGPILQGIYAGDISKMSASLILKRFFNRSKRVKPEIRGLVCPKGGMTEFFSKTECYLKSKGVAFHYDTTAKIEKEKTDVVYVLATSSKGAAEILKNENLVLAREFGKIEMVSLVKITAFFKDNLEKIKGFGVLFPRDQKVKALGILFNNFIFKKEPSELLSESFIYGGASGEEIINLDENGILRNVIEDRNRLYRGRSDIKGFHLHRWPSTLPHYTVELENRLKNIAPDLSRLEREKVYVIGNFLGRIGLSQLLEAASEIPKRIKSLHD